MTPLPRALHLLPGAKTRHAQTHKHTLAQLKMQMEMEMQGYAMPTWSSAENGEMRVPVASVIALKEDHALMILIFPCVSRCPSRLNVLACVRMHMDTRVRKRSLQHWQAPLKLNLPNPKFMMSKLLSRLNSCCLECSWKKSQVFFFFC